jgi:hypothetical protein
MTESESNGLTPTRLPSDRAAEEAIRAAERWLIKQGWKYTPADVGKRAREILEAMYGNPS